MQLRDIPFTVVDWKQVEPTVHEGETGLALWHTRQFGDVRVRLMRYVPGYAADHWCAKGHVMFCIEGSLTTELEDGRTFVLEPGSSYQVADGAERHRSSTTTGATLFCVD